MKRAVRYTFYPDGGLNTIDTFVRADDYDRAVKERDEWKSAAENYLQVCIRLQELTKAARAMVSRLDIDSIGIFGTDVSEEHERLREIILAGEEWKCEKVGDVFKFTPPVVASQSELDSMEAQRNEWHRKADESLIACQRMREFATKCEDDRDKARSWATECEVRAGAAMQSLKQIEEIHEAIKAGAKEKVEKVIQYFSYGDSRTVNGTPYYQLKWTDYVALFAESVVKAIFEEGK